MSVHITKQRITSAKLIMLPSWRSQTFFFWYPFCKSAGKYKPPLLRIVVCKSFFLVIFVGIFRENWLVLTGCLFYLKHGGTPKMHTMCGWKDT